MRTTLITAGALAALGGILAACSGGGGVNTTPATVASPVAAASLPPTITNNYFTGPSSKMTVSIKVPQRTATSAAVHAKIHALYGPKHSDQHIRTMANTSPTASLRAAGLAQNEYGKRIQTSTGRSPEYISPYTYIMEFVISDSTNSTVLVDDTAYCNSNSCTSSFTVPVGSNYNATLYLYDDCNYLLSAGTVANVNVVQGANSPLTITLNGVVAYFSVSPSVSSFIADPSQAASFTVGVQAVDADYNTITSSTTPASVLIDSNFDKINGVTLSQNASDVTPASSPLTPNADLSFNSPTFNYAGTGSESSILFTATENAGSQVVPNLYTYFTYGPSLPTTSGQQSIPVTAVQLSWGNPNGYPTSGQAGSPEFTLESDGNPSSAQVEFPSINEAGTGAFGLSETISSYSGNITLSDNGFCSGVVGYTPGPTAYQTLANSPYVVFTTYNLMSPPNTTCVITATDSNGRSAQLYFFFDQESLTIQGRAKHH